MDWKDELLVGKECHLERLMRFALEGNKPRLIYPEFSGDYNELQDIPQTCWKISSSEDSKPVLATSGLANCIGVVAYDPQKKLAFLSHSDAFTCACGHYEWDQRKRDTVYVHENGHVRSFYRELVKMGDTFSLDVKMIIGSDPDKEMIEVTRRTIENVPEQVKLRGLERVDMETIGSIAINARTGCLFTYDWQKNPNPRTLGPWDKVA